MTTLAEMISTPLDPVEIRRTFACFPSGVTAVCAQIEGSPVGMAASSFCSVSLDPPLVLFCASNTSATWARLRDVRRLGVSVLSEGHDALCRQLAGPASGRFAGVGWTATDDGAVFVEGAAAWLDCSLEREVPAGDHQIALMLVHAVMRVPESAPLVFHDSRFRQFVSPNAEDEQ
jgi:flavin reductase (DIM6/NTAB) family NADH-FMN oxidoreductase RutF